MHTKQTLDDLALFGGPSLFAEKLHVGRPNIGDRPRLMERFNDILDRRWLTNAGPYVQEFEKAVAEMAGVRHCIAMCNGTVALEIAIRALELKGEVIVPAFTFVATAHALQWQEIRPVFGDIHPRTYTLDPAGIEKLVTAHTTGILGVHLWGQPCDIEGLEWVARRHNLKLMFDAAHAFGCTWQGRPIGSFGQAEVFSFHATKFVNTLEGGAVVTNDDELARRIRLMKNFGFVEFDEVSYLGINGKMNEMSAAMGLTSLESMPRFVAANQRNYWQYRHELAGIAGLKLFSYDESEACNYQYVIAELDAAAAGLSRDQLVQLLHAENILARRYFYPGCHHMEPYRTLYRLPELPVTDQLAGRVFSLPTGTGAGEDEIRAICALLRFALGHGGDIARRMA